MTLHHSAKRPTHDSKGKRHGEFRSDSYVETKPYFFTEQGVQASKRLALWSKSEGRDGRFAFSGRIGLEPVYGYYSKSAHENVLLLKRPQDIRVDPRIVFATAKVVMHDDESIQMEITLSSDPIEPLHATIGDHVPQQVLHKLGLSAAKQKLERRRCEEQDEARRQANLLLESSSNPPARRLAYLLGGRP